MSKVLTLGESLARLSSNSGERISESTQLNLHFGGAEANVASNLAILGHEVKYATKLPEDNALMEGLVSTLRGFGADCHDILYGEGRLGSYYLEVGTGLRPSNVIYDRKYSSISLMEKNEWDLDHLFEDVSVFFISGITLALSDSWNKIGVQLIKEAKKRNVKIGFDMNYRQKMWSYETAIPVYESVLPYIDYLSASELDAIHFMGIPEINDADREYYIKEISKKYPNIQYIFGTERNAITPNSYNMTGYIWGSNEQRLVTSKEYKNHNVVDRVGSGDAFTASIFDGIIHEKNMEEIADFAIAASALKHTVYGDVNPFTRKEIKNFMGNTSNVIR